MTTTFVSRELVRDELVALFVAAANWKAVYGYMPAFTTISGRTPILTILSAGTRQEFANLFTNPASYRFEITNYVKSSSETDATVLSADAQDELDDLDRAIRQVIRNNVQLTNASNLRFDDNYSSIERGALGNVPYVRESYIIYADLPNGAS